MASKQVSTREELRGMKRADLQKLAKDHNIKANLKTDALINELVRARAAQVSPLPGPSTLRKDRSTATLILDEQENNKPEPTPKLTDSSLSSSGQGSPVRPKPQPAKPGVGGTSRPRLPGSGVIAARKAPVMKKDIIPPGVVAANPDVKGKGKIKAPVYVPSVRPVAGSSKPPVAKTLPAGKVKGRDVDAASVTRPPPIVSDLTPPLRTASHSGPSPMSILNSRIEKLENARDASRERREAELDLLRSQLKAAQDSISALAKQNDVLKARLDSVPAAASQKDMTNALARLARLEEQFSKMDVDNSVDTLTKRPLSVSSSEADLGNPYEPPPPMPRSEFQTPPNRYDRTRRTSHVLAPAAPIGSAPQTPPPHIRRYSANPDESPSPTRQPSTTGKLLVRPPPMSVPTARSSTAFAGRGIRRAASVIGDGEALLRSKRVPDSLKRGRGDMSKVHDESENESDEPSRPLKIRPRVASDDEDEEYDEPVHTAPLPYALIPATTLATPSSHVRRTPGSLHVARGRSGRASTRAQPYDKLDSPHRQHAGLSADAEEPQPQNLRDLFGPTPGPSYAGPLPFADGAIPILKLGRPSNASSYADLETPLASPSRLEPAEETPPASRTRFGTEFGSTMKTRFSD